MLLKPDPTFYASAKDAMQAPAETLAYVALLSASGNGRPDALAVIDTDPTSNAYASQVGRLDFPNTGDELHHFGWSACSSALCPNAPRPHVERRYLVVPGLRSSRIHIVDTKPDGAKAAYRPHHRARRTHRSIRLYATAHHSLRSRCHLRERAR